MPSKFAWIVLPDLGTKGDDIISSPPANGDGFVSIDGRKTYFDLFPTTVPEAVGNPSTQQVVEQTIGTAPALVPPAPAAPSKERPGSIGIGTGFIRPLPPDEASDVLGNNNNNNRIPGSGGNSVSGNRRRPQEQGGVDGAVEQGSTSTRRPFTRRPAAPPVR